MNKGKYKLFISQSNQAGFTIIESLVALLVAGLLLAAVAPVIVLSTATRVQARRVELATQAAKTYIDGVSSGSIQPPEQVLDTSTSTNPKLLDSAAVPTLEEFDKKDFLYCVDLDGGGCTKDSPKDLFIQAFRTNGDPKQGYFMGLRVYRTDAFKDSGTLKKNTSTSTKSVTQKTFTGGLGDRKAPLVEMTTEIVGSDINFKDLCTRLKQHNNDNSQC
ncbi:MAG: hormogonium polysaccharide secretion pseudopilin HpsB [Scytonema sp. PMC 1069.18]|nr:hormogonium polysaccharide secretion pseudopilin HpsB [Scytonema sp. PMC 1069.18]MEC4886996.1 hormogonium polysaccharide secretion pseudopilin HpsB [Scytonema sp. PMC 1070.18]